jgi:hypothetical protein
MNYKDAQDQSVSGVAVFGNPAMQDVIWPKDSPHPFIWLVSGDKRGYIPWSAKLASRDGWSPLHPLREDYKSIEVASK